MTQEKDPLLLKYHRDLVEKVDKALFCCEMLGIMLKHRQPDLFLSLANSLKELGAIRECLVEMKKEL